MEQHFSISVISLIFTSYLPLKFLFFVFPTCPQKKTKTFTPTASIGSSSGEVLQRRFQPLERLEQGVEQGPNPMTGLEAQPG